MPFRISIFLLAAWMLQAQQPPGPPLPRSDKDAAPEDITGYWVSVVTEDWRWRMMTPAKGDFTSVPLNPEGGKVIHLGILPRTRPTAIHARLMGPQD